MAIDLSKKGSISIYLLRPSFPAAPPTVMNYYLGKREPGVTAHQLIVDKIQQILKDCNIHDIDNYTVQVLVNTILNIEIDVFSSIELTSGKQPTHKTNYFMWSNEDLGALKVAGSCQSVLEWNPTNQSINRMFDLGHTEKDLVYFAMTGISLVDTGPQFIKVPLKDFLSNNDLYFQD